MYTDLQANLFLCMMKNFIDSDIKTQNIFIGFFLIKIVINHSKLYLIIVLYFLVSTTIVCYRMNLEQRALFQYQFVQQVH